MTKPKVLIARREHGFYGNWAHVYVNKCKMQLGNTLISLCADQFKKYSGISLKRNQSCKFKIVKVK